MHLLEFKYPSVTLIYIQQTLVNVSKYILFSYCITIDSITILLQCLMYTHYRPFFYPIFMKHYCIIHNKPYSTNVKIFRHNILIIFLWTVKKL